jgi:hypothetical protein
VGDNHRTNNNVESWHKQFKNSCNRDHDHFIRVVKKLQESQVESEIKLQRSILGLYNGRELCKKQKLKYQQINTLRAELTAGLLTVEIYFERMQTVVCYYDVDDGIVEVDDHDAAHRMAHGDDDNDDNDDADHDADNDDNGDYNYWHE